MLAASVMFTLLTEYAVWIAMLVFAYSRGGAPIAGLVAAAQLVPAAVAAPVAAAVADRRSPVVLLAGGYLAQAAAMACTAVAVRRAPATAPKATPPSRPAASASAVACRHEPRTGSRPARPGA